MAMFSGIKKSSICLDCKKSGGNCSWSSKFIPVEGWDAEFVEGSKKAVRLPSYRVKSCPEFQKDREAPKGTRVITKSELFYQKLISGGKDDDKAGV